MKTYRIKNIFGPTIHGEGLYSGSVVVFLRFAGCNRWTGLDKDRENSICKFCDTDFRGGVAMESSQILAKLLEVAPGVKRLVISGGEASLQLDVSLLHDLQDAGYTIALETNGSKDISHLRNLIDWVTVSPKQSWSETKLKEADEIKILYPPIHPEITLENFSFFDASYKFLQPVHDRDYEANLKATVCRALGNPEWRISLQTHKLLGVE